MSVIPTKRERGEEASCFLQKTARLFASLSLFCLVLSPSTLFAVEAVPAPPEGLEVTTVAEGGVGKVGQDWVGVLTLRLGFRLGVPQLLCDQGKCETELFAALEAPLRAPFSGGEGEVLRQQDWDKGADWMRLVRRLGYGRRQDAVWVRFAELYAISLNGGTVVWNHFNTISPNIYRLGASAQVRIDGIEGAVLVDDMLGPDVVAGSLGIRPGRWFDATEDTFLRRIRLSGEFAYDLNAPGDPLEPTQQIRTLLWGARAHVDLPEVLDTWRWHLYGQWNKHDSVGSGVHLGAHWGMEVSEEWLTLKLQAEWIASQGGYLPRYVGPLYGVERIAQRGFGGDDDGGKLWRATKLQEPGRQWFGTLGIGIPTWQTRFTLALGDELWREDADTMLAALHVGPIGRVALSGVVTRSGLSQAWLPWQGSGQTLAAAEARVLLWKDVVYAMGRYGHQWDLETVSELDVWQVGVGVQWAIGFQGE